VYRIKDRQNTLNSSAKNESLITLISEQTSTDDPDIITTEIESPETRRGNPPKWVVSTGRRENSKRESTQGGRGFLSERRSSLSRTSAQNQNKNE